MQESIILTCIVCLSGQQLMLCLWQQICCYAIERSLKAVGAVAKSSNKIVKLTAPFTFKQLVSLLDDITRVVKDAN